jgi:disulfide bond formation protein DsbB
MPDVATTNLLVSYATLLLHVPIFGLLLAISFPEYIPHFPQKVHARFGLWIAFGFTLIATLVTLYYSEYLGVLPCSYCWLQRVFLYPQVVLFFIAALKKDHRIAIYSMALSFFGALIALYHHFLQMGGAHFLPCPANGNAIDCATPTFMTWGFITFPYMSLVFFVFLFLYMVALRTIWRKFPLAAIE